MSSEGAGRQDSAGLQEMCALSQGSRISDLPVVWESGNRFGPLRKTYVYLVCQEPDDCLIIFCLELFHSSHSLLHT